MMNINSKRAIGLETTEFKLYINNSRRLLEIQNEFNAIFPFLKIEFFKIPHKIGDGTPKKSIYERDKFISDCRSSKNEGFILVNESCKVSDIEQKFADDFGLSIQIFRKSGKVWLETSATDHWTLREQNLEGEELSS